jgi:transcriptional regulator with XRE-family HTH domain
MTRPSLIAPERAARDARIRARRQDGWTLERIARGEGLSHQRVSQITEGVVPKRQEARRCSGCGAKIERRSATGLCRSCLKGSDYRKPRRWSDEACIAALREFHATYGHSPRAADLSPSQARRNGQEELVERFATGRFPSLETLTKRFGGLNQALAAAGLPVRKRGERLT